jgi:hypothetical protein
MFNEMVFAYLHKKRTAARFFHQKAFPIIRRTYFLRSSRLLLSSTFARRYRQRGSTVFFGS